MDTSVFHLSEADNIVCVWIQSPAGPYPYADPIRLHVPKDAIQRTRFPQQTIGDVTEICLGKPSHGHQRFILLESVPEHFVNLIIKSEFCITHCTFDSGREDLQERAHIALLSCRLATYMDTVMKFLLNAYVHRTEITDFDITCFEQEFITDIQELYVDIYYSPDCNDQRALLEWCVIVRDSVHRPDGDLDTILYRTHMLEHNRNCLGTGCGVLIL
jgi:hypothetical protein